MADPRRRALVAAFVGVVGAVLGIAGAGHAYLRQWRRALAWFLFLVGATLVLVWVFADPRNFTDPAAVTPATLPLEVTLPLIGLLVLSVLDAYRIAGRQSDGRVLPTRGGSDPVGDATGGVDGDRRPAGATEDSCPHCGRAADPALDFCWYCAEPTDEDRESGTVPGDSDGDDGDATAR